MQKYQKLKVSGIKVYAFHGCMEEEGVIGGKYKVDVTFMADLLSSAESDNLKETIDYVEVTKIVKEEMAIRSKLIEHVSLRIAKKMKSRFSTTAKEIEIKVTKFQPPVKGDVENVSYSIVI